MDASHAIEVDPRTSLVTIIIRGFFDEAALLRLAGDRTHAYQQLRCPLNEHLTLCDVSDCKLQTQDMVAGFQRLIADSRHRSRKLAFVVGSSLSRMQIRRMVAGRDDVRSFYDRDEAIAWLGQAEAEPVRQAVAVGLRA